MSTPRHQYVASSLVLLFAVIISVAGNATPAQSLARAPSSESAAAAPCDPAVPPAVSSPAPQPPATPAPQSPTPPPPPPAREPAAASAPAPQPAVPQAGIRASDIQYLGAFALPNPSNQASRFAYGGHALSYSPANNGGAGTLYVAGHDHHQLVAEVSIPTPLKTGDAKTLPVAAMVQPFADVTDGLKNKTPSPKIGGLLVTQGKLLWTIYKYYNVDGQRLPSHGMSGLNLSAGSDATGMWSLGQFHIQRTAGFLAEIPSAWQSRFGFSYLSGASTRAGRSTSSDGPSAYGFNLPGQGTAANAALSSKEFLSYPIDHKATYAVNGATHQWKGANAVTGMAFPVSASGQKSAVIYAVSVGEHAGDWYGLPQEFPGTQCGGGKGYHAGPYRAQLWLYDPNALLSTGQSGKNSWDHLPYERVDITQHFFTDPCLSMGGMGYDSVNRTLYVVEKSGYQFNQYERTPVIHVFQVQ